jgi:opacity protein-like surface antigen
MPLKRLVVVVSSVLCLGFVTTVQASDEPIKNVYLAIKGGVFLPNSETSGLKNYDNGYNGDAALGIRFNNFFGIELGAGYIEAKMKKPFDDNKVKIIPITGNAILTIPLGSVVNLFAGGGAGYYMAKFAGGGGSDESKNVLGYQALGGIDFNLGESFSIGGEIKRFWAKPEFEGNNTKVKVDVGGTVVDAGIKLRF